MAFDFVRFTDVLSHIVDNRGKTCPVGDAGLPLIATNCVNGVDLYPAYETNRYVSEDTYKSWFRGHPVPGDILFVCKGSPGRTSLVPAPVDFCIAQDMVAVRADKTKIDPAYLFAALRSKLIQDQISNMHVGTLIPHFKKGDFDKLMIPIPERSVQEWIGDFYLTLSKRINLLKETNKTLEAISQAIFKSWFIDFDQVRAKVDGRVPTGIDGESAALFPDELVESELGLIPKGWVCTELANVCSYLNRGVSPKYTENGGILVLNQKCVRDFLVDYTKGRRHDLAQRKVDGRFLEVGDVLVNSTGVGTLGRAAQILNLDEPAIVDSHVTVIRSNQMVSWPYLGEYIKKIQPTIELMGEGSTGQTELSRAKLGAVSRRVV